MNPKKFILYSHKPDFPMYSVSASTYTQGEATMDVVSHNFGHDYEIVGSCDGLLLVLRTDSRQLGIWNPLTREYKRLPRSDRINSDVRWPDRFGFGCVSSSEKESYSNNYKVVQIDWSSERKDSGNAHFPKSAQVFLYTTVTNSWRRVADIPSFNYCSLSVLVNSKLHFLIRKVDDLKEVLTFDIADEEFGAMTLPDYDGGYCCTIAELNGKLCAVCVKHRIISVWAMKEHGVKESWINMFCIDLGKETFSGHFFFDVSPLLTFSDGKILLYGTFFDEKTCLTTLLIASADSVTCCKLDGVTCRYKSIIYEESLLSPNAI